ncbi:hypothetical protein QTV49_004232 [Vibrio vulnificus]|nr:hypothetical protein [Vibrio vulnificus]
MRRVTPVSKRMAQVRPPKIFKTPSASRVTLFSLSPKNPSVSSVEVLRRYATPSDDGEKKLFLTLHANKMSTYKGLRKFTLRMDRFKEKLFIDVFDLEGNRLSDDEFFFKFDDIFDAAMTINDVKIARGTRKKVDGQLNSLYSQPEAYKLKSLGAILNFIEDGTIGIDVRVSPKLNKSGETSYHDHGVAFRVNHSKLDNMFSKAS